MTTPNLILPPPLRDDGPLETMARPCCWQPIETAPRDGTDILVCVTHNLGPDEWETITWVDWRRDDDVVWPVYRDRIDIPFPPSFWQPIPAPPIDTKEGE